MNVLSHWSHINVFFFCLDITVLELSDFLFRKSSFLFAFLLSCEGLSFFFIPSSGVVTFLGSREVDFSLVSREKEKLEPIDREKENFCPWLDSAWQNSKHLIVRAKFSSSAGGIFTD